MTCPSTCGSQPYGWMNGGLGYWTKECADAGRCVNPSPSDTSHDVRAALIECIRAAEMADWDLQTEGLADAILARFEVRLKP